MDSDEANACFEFLQKCGRKKSKMLVIIIEQFLSIMEWDSSEVTKSEIDTFMKVYPFLKSARNTETEKEKMGTVKSIIQSDNKKQKVFNVNTDESSQKQKEVGTKEVKKNSSVSTTAVDNEALKRGKSALAAFGLK